MGQFRTFENQGISLKKSISISIEQIWQNDDLAFFENEVKQYPGNIVVSTLLWENPPIGEWIHRLRRVVEIAASYGKRLVLIINSWYYKDRDLLLNCGLQDICFFDYFLAAIYYRLIINQDSPVCSTWDPKLTNWLFLTGKPAKPNRIGFLYKLDRENMLDHCIWSLHTPDYLHEQCLPYLYDLDQNNAREWMKRFSRNPDNINFFYKSNSGYFGIPYGDTYKQSLFQVVSETDTENIDPWLTEKTWNSIINRRPFMIFGGCGSHQKLKSFGFLTFDEFIIDYEFDTNRDLEIRMDSLIKNIRHWQQVLPQHAQTITDIVEHNHKQLISRAKNNINDLMALMLRYDLTVDLSSVITFYALWEQKNKNPA